MRKKLLSMKTTTTSTDQKTAIHRDKTILEQVIESSGAVHFDPPAFQDNSAEFPEDIPRQNAAPFSFDGWLHSGLND